MASDSWGGGGGRVTTKIVIWISGARYHHGTASVEVEREGVYNEDEIRPIYTVSYKAMEFFIPK